MAANGLRNLANIVLGPVVTPTAATDGKGPAAEKPAKERRGLFGRRR